MQNTKIKPRYSQKQIDEAYQHMHPYLKEDKKLQTMCKNCPHYKGTDHNYDACLDKMCFTFYLAYEEWYGSWYN